MPRTAPRRPLLTPDQVGIARRLHWHYDMPLLEIAFVLQVTPQRIERTFRIFDEDHPLPWGVNVSDV